MILSAIRPAWAAMEGGEIQVIVGSRGGRLNVIGMIHEVLNSVGLLLVHHVENYRTAFQHYLSRLGKVPHSSSRLFLR